MHVAAVMGGLVAIVAGTGWIGVPDPLGPTTHGPNFFKKMYRKGSNASQRFSNWRHRMGKVVRPADIANSPVRHLPTYKMIEKLYWLAHGGKPNTTTTTLAPNDYVYTEEEMEDLRVKPNFPWQLASAAKTAKKLGARYLRAGQQKFRFVLTPEPRKIQLLEGSRVELVCPGIDRRNLSNPMHWTYDGLILRRRTPRPRFHIGHWDRNLDVSPVLEEDSGHYECLVWNWDPAMRPRKGQFLFRGQLTLHIRSLPEAIIGGMINFGLTTGFAFLLLTAWIPLYAFCIVRAGERGLAEEDEVQHRAFLRRQLPDAEESAAYDLPTDPKEHDPSARSAVTFVRNIEANRTIRG